MDQNEYLTTTPGHNTRLFSYQVVATSAPADAPSAEKIARREKPSNLCSESNPAFEENLSHPGGPVFAIGEPSDPHHFQWWKVEKFGPDAITPYWIMHVPRQIIDRHGLIFTPQGRAMMAALFRITNPPHQEGPRQMQLRADAGPSSQETVPIASAMP